MFGAPVGLDFAGRSVDLLGVVPVPTHHLSGLVTGEAVMMDDTVDQVVLAILVTQL